MEWLRLGSGKWDILRGANVYLLDFRTTFVVTISANQMGYSLADEVAQLEGATC